MAQKSAYYVHEKVIKNEIIKFIFAMKITSEHKTHPPPNVSSTFCGHVGMDVSPYCFYISSYKYLFWTIVFGGNTLFMIVDERPLITLRTLFPMSACLFHEA